MKNSKYYFCDQIDEEMCYPLDYILQEMKERSYNEIIVEEAIRMTKTDIYYCKANNEVGLRSYYYESCGKCCDKYEPRNKVSGCCKHRGYCYEQGQEFILTLDGKLTKN